MYKHINLSKDIELAHVTMWTFVSLMTSTVNISQSNYCRSMLFELTNVVGGPVCVSKPPRLELNTQKLYYLQYCGTLGEDFTPPPGIQYYLVNSLSMFLAKSCILN